jgi:hypothetical protein
MLSPVVHHEEANGASFSCKIALGPIRENEFSSRNEPKCDRMYSPLIAKDPYSLVMTSYNPFVRTAMCDNNCLDSASLAKNKRDFYMTYADQRKNCQNACKHIEYTGVLIDDVVGAAIRSYLPKHSTFSSSVSMSGGLEYTSNSASRHLNRFVCDIGDAIIVDVFRMVHNSEDKVQLTSLNRIFDPLVSDSNPNTTSAELVHNWLRNPQNRKIFVGFAKCSNEATDYFVTVQNVEISVYKYFK